MSTAIWWIRRDLRLADNQALAAARQYDRVIPVYILDPVLWTSDWVGEKRQAFLLAGLRELDHALQARGSRLIVRLGDPAEELTKLVQETHAAAIWAEADYSPYARKRDQAIAKTLSLILVAGVTLFEPGQVMKNDGTPYVVYTPFSKTCKLFPAPTAADCLPAPDYLNPCSLPSLGIPDMPALPASVPFHAGEAEGQRRLHAFAGQWQDPIRHYAERRDRLDLAGTSTLSPYLRLGMVSVRQVAAQAWECLAAARLAGDKEAQRGAEVWLNELLWREFYIHILYHFPYVRQSSFRPEYDGLAWENDEGQFLAWQEGRTGYPVVDAAMRQLSATGWMHNRGRMIVASFLVKDLLIDWRWGENWFMQQLVDGDPAANNGGWQWTAGTGTDAAPYFRIFSPVSQSQRFDPEGQFIRRWLPELNNVPLARLHAPWEMSAAEQKAARCIIGQDYPAPMIDRTQTRPRTLQAYAEARDSR
ncbi:MAG: deoxyribodipyrimidine photo-lyase [Chloroflexi bacterium]|nr:deoxyribodipyrimidine photo-lyase [Chloroflexota bacterium]